MKIENKDGAHGAAILYFKKICSIIVTRSKTNSIKKETTLPGIQNKVFRAQSVVQRGRIATNNKKMKEKKLEPK